jgi:HemY protein
MPKSASPSVPPVIPIVRPPDDPGIDDEPAADEFAEPISPSQGQAGGWRGFLSRWGG